MSFDLNTYLARIGLDSVPPGAAGLAALQGAQMRAIPFENIDPLLGTVPDLDSAAIWDKLVLRRRGGYCFELNGLIGEALRSLGHAPIPVLGRVRMGASRGGPRSHLAWIVTLDGAGFLVDAGFGGPGATTPLRLDTGADQVIGGSRFRVGRDPGTGERIVETATGTEWFALYGFDDATVTDADLAAANFLCATWPQSPFRDNLMLARFTPDGRVSAFNRQGRTIRQDAEDKWQFGSAADLADCLEGVFGLVAAAPLAPALWERPVRGTHASRLMPHAYTGRHTSHGTYPSASASSGERKARWSAGSSSSSPGQAARQNSWLLSWPI